MGSVRPPPDEPEPLRAIAATLFVSDPSAEAERLAQVLRTVVGGKTVYEAAAQEK